MPELLPYFVAAIFLLAGTVKGAIGLGMPAIVMGSPALVMSLLEAAAILVVPMFITNIWQMLAGGRFKSLTARLWPVLVGVLVGTLAGAKGMTELDPRIGRGVLGGVLVIYGLSGFVALPVVRRLGSGRVLGLFVGGVTGLLGAVTGVFVLPSVPYINAMKLDKDELVQALGIFFMASTVALLANLVLGGALDWSVGPLALMGTALALAGMALGQRVRAGLDPVAFRKVFFSGLLLLGLYLVARSLA
ncbi:MAG: sulfite exporter TauE/SafE family protein [Alphaproteobacteria bacterium]|nr:sulfite exporter TauE/SafE family protein [Alphaproteobacteria bacterium]